MREILHQTHPNCYESCWQSPDRSKHERLAGNVDIPIQNPFPQRKQPTNQPTSFCPTFNVITSMFNFHLFLSSCGKLRIHFSFNLGLVLIPIKAHMRKSRRVGEQFSSLAGQVSSDLCCVHVHSGADVSLCHHLFLGRMWAVSSGQKDLTGRMNYIRWLETVQPSWRCSIVMHCVKKFLQQKCC